MSDKRAIFLKLDSNLIRSIKIAAINENKTLTDYITKILIDWVNKNLKKSKKE